MEEIVKSKYQFLYEKAYPIGIVSSNNSLFWLSREFIDLKTKFETSTLNELILELIYIFNQSPPNYRILLSLFDCSYVDSTHILSNKISRKAHDVISIEIFLNKEKTNVLIIKKFILTFQSNNLENYLYNLKKYNFLSFGKNYVEFDF